MPTSAKKSKSKAPASASKADKGRQDRDPWQDYELEALADTVNLVSSRPNFASRIGDVPKYDSAFWTEVVKYLGVHLPKDTQRLSGTPEATRRNISKVYWRFVEKAQAEPTGEGRMPAHLRSIDESCRVFDVFEGPTDTEEGVIHDDFEQQPADSQDDLSGSDEGSSSIEDASDPETSQPYASPSKRATPKKSTGSAKKSRSTSSTVSGRKRGRPGTSAGDGDMSQDSSIVEENADGTYATTKHVNNQSEIDNKSLPKRLRKGETSEEPRRNETVGKLVKKMTQSSQDRTAALAEMARSIREDYDRLDPGTTMMMMMWDKMGKAEQRQEEERARREDERTRREEERARREEEERARREEERARREEERARREDERERRARAEEEERRRQRQSEFVQQQMFQMLMLKMMFAGSTGQLACR